MTNARRQSKALLLLWHFGSICCHPLVFHSPKVTGILSDVNPCTGSSSTPGLGHQVRVLFPNLMLIHCSSNHNTSPRSSPEMMLVLATHSSRASPSFTHLGPYYHGLGLHFLPAGSSVSLYVSFSQEISYLEPPQVTLRVSLNFYPVK